MTTYFISFFTISFLTVSSPGPAVIFTIYNTLNYTLKKTIMGILGVATGILFVAIFATSLLIFAANTFDFALLIISIVGSLYFFYLSFNYLQYNAKKEYQKKEQNNLFRHGVMISLLNPKALAFFIFIFPLYLDSKAINFHEPVLLSLIFSLNVILVHSIYTCIFTGLAKFIELNKLIQVFNKISVVLFFTFGIFLVKQVVENIANI